MVYEKLITIIIIYEMAYWALKQGRYGRVSDIMINKKHANQNYRIAPKIARNFNLYIL